MAHKHMNVEIGTEAAQCPEKVYLKGIFVAECHTGYNEEFGNGCKGFLSIVSSGDRITRSITTPLRPHPTYPPHLTIFIAVSGLTLEVDTLLACELKPKQHIFLTLLQLGNIFGYYFANLFLFLTWPTVIRKP
jgi:hypothetical protein